MVVIRYQYRQSCSLKKDNARDGLDKSLQRPAQQGQINILLIFTPKSTP